MTHIRHTDPLLGPLPLSTAWLKVKAQWDEDFRRRIEEFHREDEYTFRIGRWCNLARKRSTQTRK